MAGIQRDLLGLNIKLVATPQQKEKVKKLHEVIAYISTHWIDWICIGITSVVGLAYNNLKKQQQENEKKNIALRNGMQSLLRDRIIQTYNYYKDKGCCPIYAKENMTRMYDAYHDLNGNDVATKLKDEMLEMPTEEEKV